MSRDSVKNIVLSTRDTRLDNDISARAGATHSSLNLELKHSKTGREVAVSTEAKITRA